MSSRSTSARRCSTSEACVFLRRGLWADVQRHWPEAACAHLTIDPLAELPLALARHVLLPS